MMVQVPRRQFTEFSLDRIAGEGFRFAFISRLIRLIRVNAWLPLHFCFLLRASVVKTSSKLTYLYQAPSAC